MKYSSLEHKVARALDSFPFLKSLAKKTYQRINFLFYREKGFKYKLHPGVKMTSVDDWGRGVKANGGLFFGYYDKPPWSFDQHSMLLHRVTETNKAEIIEVRRKSSSELRLLGRTHTWNWQQGSMTQWISRNEVIFNTIVRGKLGAKVVDLERDETSFIPWPVQTAHPNGREMISLNYKRLHRIRPEYGYAPEVANFGPEMPFEDDGLWSVDIESKTADLMITLADLRDYQPRPEMKNADHKVNHAVYSPQGGRIVFMHRWVGNEGKFSRLYVSDSEGQKLRLLMDNRMVSHYNWRDEDHLIVWGRTQEHGDHYYLINVTDGTYEIIGKGILDKYGDGHPSYSPDGRWIVTDTYPDKARQRHLLIFDTKTEELIELGRFFAPWKFEGPCRCDLHPRWSPDGNLISIDSAHEGNRQSYVIDVRCLVS